MADMRIATTDGAGKVLEDATVQGFRAELRGSLLALDDASYDETRKVWNGMIDRRPALIARCGGVADVIAAVRFARTHRLLVSVRGGGHNTPGIAVCEGGLMIDLAGMRSVRIDVPGRPREPRAVLPGASSTARPRRSAWPPPAARSHIPASAG